MCESALECKVRFQDESEEPKQTDLKNKKTMKISFDAESLEEALSVSQKFGELFSQTFSL